LSGAGVISGTPDTAGVSNFTVTVVDTNGCDGTKNYSININAVSCLFCDDFEDGTLDPQWMYKRPTWSEVGGQLIGTPSGRKALVIATPVFAGCSVCSIEVQVQTAGGRNNRVSIFTWYQSNNEKLELTLKEESNRWMLRQYSSGKIVAKGKAILAIDPNVNYVVLLSYDGTNFELSIDGVLVLTLPAGATPNGTIAFQVKKTTGRFGYVQVN
jgi:hypothetical protein